MSRTFEPIAAPVPFEQEYPEEAALLVEMYRSGRIRKVAPWALTGHSPLWAIKPQFPGLGRNDACPCGSGRKYKKCCI